MLDHYWLFPINLFLITLFSLSFLFYSFVFPRKNIHHLILLICFSIIPTISIFRIGVFESGQFQEHVSVSIPFYKALAEGNFFPRWASNTCSGYGCPLFSFQYQLIYYLSSFFHFFGFTYIFSMKIVMAIAYVFSGVSMYLFSRRELSKNGAFFASTLFLAAPYQFGAMHFRGSIPEQLAFALVPLVFYAVAIGFPKPSFAKVIFLAVQLFLLFLAHQAIFLAVMPLLLVYTGLLYVRKRKYEGLLFVCASFVIFTFISAYRWVPMLLERDMIQAGGISGIEFQPFLFYIFSPIENRFGLLFQGNNGTLYPNIGYFQLISVIVAVILILRRKIKKMHRGLAVALVVMFFTYLYMMVRNSNPIWHSIPFALYILNAWRLIVVQAFIVALIGGIVWGTIKKSLYLYGLCLAVFIGTIFNWGNRSLDVQKNDLYFENSTYIQELPGKVEATTPIWVDVHAPWIGKRTEDVKTLHGNIQVHQLVRTSHSRNYLIQSDSNAVIAEQTYYYPGWKLYVDHQETRINSAFPDYNGLMVFELSKGLHYIEFRLEETSTRKIADAISIISVTVTVLLLFLANPKVLNKRRLPFPRFGS